MRIEFIDLFTEGSFVRQDREKVQPMHIFHTMIEYYGDRLSEAELGSLRGQFEEVEQALALSRRRDLDSAELIFRKIAAQQLEYPEFVRSGMLSMIKAVASYYVHACGRNEEAIGLMEEAIGYSMTQAVDFPLMLTGAQEQWRNIVVVRSRQGDAARALSELNALISFSLTGEIIGGKGVEERFHFDAGGVIADRFWEVEPVMHDLMLSNITYNSFRGALEFCNYDFALAGGYFGQIISQAVRAMQGRRVIQWARSPIMLLHLFYTGQTELFLEGISREFNDVRQAMPALQWLIIGNYVLLCREAGLDLESHPNYKNFFEAYMSLGMDNELLKPQRLVNQETV